MVCIPDGDYDRIWYVAPFSWFIGSLWKGKKQYSRFMGSLTTPMKTISPCVPPLLALISPTQAPLRVNLGEWVV